MTPKVKKPFYFWRRLFTLPILAYLIWYVTVPTFEIEFSKDASDRLRFVMVNGSDIYNSGILPGESIGGAGRLFSNKDFEIEFSWRYADRDTCYRIVPTWPVTKVYLDRNGEIDSTQEGNADITRLRPCGWLRNSK